MSIPERLAAVRANIDAASAAAGRDPASVRLVAVSKTFGVGAVRAAVQAGQLDFGENQAQELRDKARELVGVRWHFIGRLQTNKAKYVAPVAFRVHALESEAQADALAARAPGPVACLVQVNVGREPQKGGVLPEDALALCERLAGHPGISLKGLTCLPPAADDPEASAPFFAELADLAARGRSAGLPLTELSMGMSHDYEVAIRHGATWVRVGTAIFGER